MSNDTIQMGHNECAPIPFRLGTLRGRARNGIITMTYNVPITARLVFLHQFPTPENELRIFCMNDGQQVPVLADFNAKGLYCPRPVNQPINPTILVPQPHLSNQFTTPTLPQVPDTLGTRDSPITILDNDNGPATSQEPPASTQPKPSSPLKVRLRYLGLLHIVQNGKFRAWLNSFRMASRKYQEEYCREYWPTNEAAKEDLEYVCEFSESFDETRLNRKSWAAMKDNPVIHTKTGDKDVDADELREYEEDLLREELKRKKLGMNTEENLAERVGRKRYLEEKEEEKRGLKKQRRDSGQESEPSSALEMDQGSEEDGEGEEELESGPALRQGIDECQGWGNKDGEDEEVDDMEAAMWKGIDECPEWGAEDGAEGGEGEEEDNGLEAALMKEINERQG